MISQSSNRVQAIKNKFENLQQETAPVARKNSTFVTKHLNKQIGIAVDTDNKYVREGNNKENTIQNFNEKSVSKKESESDSSEDCSPKPNSSYLYNKTDPKHLFSDTKKSLVRQSSDPGKKLHRSHAFRCDRSQKIVSPKRHGSYNGKEIGEFSMKMGEKRLSKERLKRLGNFLEDQMRKENFVLFKNELVDEDDNVPKENFELFQNKDLVDEENVQRVHDSLPDSVIPQHILDQYAKVVKPKKKDPEAMTDSGVSSETENLEEEKTSRIKKLMSQFEKSEKDDDSKNNLDTMVNLCASSETMKLERKNPHLKLTDTLKKALKQPLPAGPPPKKPPRIFTVSPVPECSEKPKKDARKMLEKLEQALQKREILNQANKNDYDIVEGNENESSETENNEYDLVELRTVPKKPKEIHYLCTEILNINKTLPNLNQNSANNCFKSLNCTLTNSTVSLPYTRLSLDSNKDISNKCSCSNDELDLKNRRLSSFLSDNKCYKCKINENNNGFKCHLNCKCRLHNSEFFVDNEHIYDEPCVDVSGRRKSKYGMLNLSKSLEDLRVGGNEEKIYDIPSEVSRPETPEFTTSSPKSDFQKLRQSFETSFQETETRKPKTDTSFNETSTRKTLSIAEIKRLSAGDVDRLNESKKFATVKPPMKPKPIFVKKSSMSANNVAENEDLDTSVGKFATETRRYRRQRGENTRFSLPKKDNTQLDIDRENLNRLMNEIYVTVTEACNMEKPASFPTSSDGSNSEDSVKLTRSLTEKRKNYVRRVSSKVAYLDRKNTRFRHQTSVCSYKSEIVDSHPYNTFRSWKSFRRSTSHVNIDNSKMADRESIDSKCNLTDSKGNLLSMKDDFDCSDSIDNLSIDEKTGCVDIELPFERERGLFNICLLVGLNYMTGQAYVKSVFPEQVQVPPHIENLVFPETLSGCAADSSSQCHSIVLTDERGERAYGYCRRVLPEGATTCLPLCYCLIGKYRAPGFYYKVLQEIESHHGSSEVEIHSILQQLFETDFPHPGEELTITYTRSQAIHKSYRSALTLDDIKKCQTMPDMRRSDQSDHSVNKSDHSVNKSDRTVNKIDHSVNKSELMFNEREVIEKSDFDKKCEAISDRLPDFYDLENNNSPKKVMLNVERPRIKTIKRPIDPRSDEHNISVLTECLGAGLTIKVLGSLLLERKVIIVGDHLSQVSSCMEALQAILYPFVWQQPLISIVPAEIEREVLEAPLPLLAGVLRTRGEIDTSGVVFEEGMLIDLTHPSKVLFYQGDESTILPTSSYKTLKTTLQMETKQKEKQDSTRNIMIAEAFLRFFVDILGDFWRCFSVGELKEGMLGKGDVIFDKDGFIKQTSSKQNQYFLEWFTETAMFTHFIQNMAVIHSENKNAKTESQQNCLTKTENGKNNSTQDLKLVDTPLPDFYGLFQDRVKSRTKPEPKIVENKNNYKNALNKRVKLLKTKLRELVA